MRKFILSISTVFLVVILLLTIGVKSIDINSENTIQNSDNTETGTQEYGINQDGVVTFNDEYFDYLHYQVEENPLKYDGKEVIITGFVYKSSDFNENEFKVARMASSFCSDPPYVLGLMIQIEDADNFEHREWVTVKGTLVVTSYVDPKTNFEYEKVHVEPKSIKKIETRSDYFLY